MFNNLANGLSTRFDQFGKMEDLEDAISFYLEAFTLCPLGHPHRSMCLNNLADAMSTRFKKLAMTKLFQIMAEVFPK